MREPPAGRFRTDPIPPPRSSVMKDFARLLLAVLLPVVVWGAGCSGGGEPTAVSVPDRRAAEGRDPLLVHRAWRYALGA